MSPVEAAPLADSPLAHEIEFLAVKAAAQGTRVANRRLAPLGLRVRSYSALALACSGAASTQRDFAEFLSLDPSQIVALVDDLERAGLVQREADPEDRRSNVVRATAAGRRLFQEARRETAAAEAFCLARLDDDERDQLRHLLRKLVLPIGPDTDDSAQERR